MLLPRKFDRRDFLKGLGTSAMLLPYLPMLKARAASIYPTRAIFIVNGEGTIDESLWPTGTETDFTFPVGSILEPLAPIKQNMIAIRNLNRVLRGNDAFGQHERNMADVLTAGTINPGPGFGGGGWAMYPSVDQVIANTVPQPTRYQTLEYAAMPGDGGDQMQRIIFAGSNQPITPMSDPVATFQRVFGDLSMSQAQQTAQFAQKKSVLDLLSKQLGVVRQRISAADYQKVDNHLEAIRALEVSLQPGGLSASCVAPTQSGAIDLTNTLNYPMVVQLQNDIMVRSLICDMTRIASMQYSRAQCPLYFQWINVNSQHHQMTHDDTADDRVKRTLIQRWYAQQVTSIAQALQAVPEGSGTMLDNTVILWTNESGNLGQAHIPFGAPTVIVGGGGGYFKTGRYIANPNQLYYSKQTLVDVCHAMGATSINHLGDPDYGDSGPMPTLKA